MKKIEIKELLGDSLEISREMCQYAFYPTPKDELQHTEPQFQKDAYVAALFENDIPIASTSCIPLTQNVRGKIFKCGGIADVATYPEARRRGYAKKLLQHHLLKMKEAGQVFSVLYPFNEQFYEKLGYITFPHIKTAKFSPKILAHLLSMEIEGDVERHLLKDNFDAYLTVLNKMQKIMHGFTIKPPSALNSIKEKFNAWLAIAKVGGEIKGFILYNVTKPFEIFKIFNFYYEDSNTKYLLLQYLAKHINQFEKIEMELKPDELIECWVADSEVSVQTKSFAASSMGRVVSVENISGMEVGEGNFSAKIIDADCSWNNNSFSFSAVDGKLVVEKTENHDCTLMIQGLSALIFGGYDPHDFLFRSWSDATFSTEKEMRDLFPRQIPYIHSRF